VVNWKYQNAGKVGWESGKVSMCTGMKKGEGREGEDRFT
jgi:hypothetical protein